MDGKKYDYKEAYNKNLTPKARLHYLENARHDEDTPLQGNCTGSPNKFMGANLTAMDPMLKQKMASELMTNVPPAPSNTMGNARPVFSLPVQQNAKKMFGDAEMMQNAVGAPPLFKKKCNKKKY